MHANPRSRIICFVCRRFYIQPLNKSIKTLLDSHYYNNSHFYHPNPSEQGNVCICRSEIDSDGLFFSFSFCLKNVPFLSLLFANKFYCTFSCRFFHLSSSRWGFFCLLPSHLFIGTVCCAFYTLHIYLNTFRGTNERETVCYTPCKVCMNKNITSKECWRDWQRKEKKKTHDNKKHTQNGRKKRTPSEWMWQSETFTITVDYNCRLKFLPVMCMPVE